MIDEAISTFWANFLASQEAQGIADPVLYEACSVGASKEAADLGAKLILDERKTATSALQSEFSEELGPPVPGTLSILLNGSEEPVAVLQTLEINLRKLSELDENFAKDYGEWDLTLETLRSKLASYYRPLLQSTDSNDEDDMELLCERFRVIFRKS